MAGRFCSVLLPNVNTYSVCCAFYKVILKRMWLLKYQSYPRYRLFFLTYLHEASASKYIVTYQRIVEWNLYILFTLTVYIREPYVGSRSYDKYEAPFHSFPYKISFIIWTDVVLVMKEDVRIGKYILGLLLHVRQKNSYISS